MLILTPVSLIQSGYYGQQPVSSIDNVAQQAAYDYALAHARAEAARREAARREAAARARAEVARRAAVARARSEAARQEAFRRRQVQDRMRRQALLDLYADAAMFASRTPQVQLFDAPVRRPSAEYQLLPSVVTSRPQRHEQAYAHIVTQQYPPSALRRGEIPRGERPVHVYVGGRDGPQARRAEQPSVWPRHDSDSVDWSRPSPSPAVRSAIGRLADIPECRPPLPRRVREHLQDRLRSESDQEVQDALRSLLSKISPPASSSPSAPIDVKGKGRVRETVPITTPSTSVAPTQEGPADFLELMIKFYEALREITDTSSAVETPTHIPIADGVDVKGKQKEAVPEADVASTSATQNSNIDAPSNEARVPSPGPSLNIGEVNLRRTPALSPAVAAKLLNVCKAKRSRRLSLGEIEAVEEALRTLEASFVFPTQLDFSDALTKEHSSDSGLAYTSINSPVHTYEHALNALLTRLDAVESGGDDQVRGRRKEVVQEVEHALREIERKVEESRESDAAKGSETEQEPELKRQGSVEAREEAPVTEANVDVATADAVEVQENVQEAVQAAEPTDSPVDAEVPSQDMATTSADVLVVSENVSPKDTTPAAIEESASPSPDVDVVSGSGVVVNENHASILTTEKPDTDTVHDDAPPMSVTSPPLFSLQDAVEDSIPESLSTADQEAVEDSAPEAPAPPTADQELPTPAVVEVESQPVDVMVADVPAVETVDTPSPSIVGSAVDVDVASPSVDETAVHPPVPQPSRESHEVPAGQDAHPSESGEFVSPTSSSATPDSILKPDSNSEPATIEEPTHSSPELPTSQPETSIVQPEISTIQTELAVPQAADAKAADADTSSADGYSSEGDAFLLQSPFPSSPQRTPRHSESDEEIEIIQHHDAKGADGESADEWCEVEGDGL